MSYVGGLSRFPIKLLTWPHMPSRPSSETIYNLYLSPPMKSISNISHKIIPDETPNLGTCAIPQRMPHMYDYLYIKSLCISVIIELKSPGMIIFTIMELKSPCMISFIIMELKSLCVIILAIMELKSPCMIIFTIMELKSLCMIILAIMELKSPCLIIFTIMELKSLCM